MLLFSLLNMFYILKVQAYKTSKWLAIFNEFTILICAYMMVIYLDCDHVDFSTNLSWFFITLCCFNMFTNISTMIYGLGYNGYKSALENRGKKEYD